MKLNLKNIPILPEILRRAELASARFALREAGNLLHAAAPLVHQAGDRFLAWSQHPGLQSPPPSFDI